MKFNLKFICFWHWQSSETLKCEEWLFDEIFCFFISFVCHSFGSSSLVEWVLSGILNLSHFRHTQKKKFPRFFALIIENFLFLLTRMKNLMRKLNFQDELSLTTTRNPVWSLKCLFCRNDNRYHILVDPRHNRSVKINFSKKEKLEILFYFNSSKMNSSNCSIQNKFKVIGN